MMWILVYNILILQRVSSCISQGQLGLGQSSKYQSDPEPVPNELLPRPVIQISCCETTCAAVTGEYNRTDLNQPITCLQLTAIQLLYTVLFIVLAEGKLYMWGKNAGLIQSEKSSQYFQFEPHHIKTEGKNVKQVIYMLFIGMETAMI